MAELYQVGEFVTRGEEKTARFLRDNLPKEWQVFPNKLLVFPNGNCREVDFVILGEHRIFVVDEKGFRGKIHGNDTFWVLDSKESLVNPLNKMEMVARRLAGYLRDQVAGLSDAARGGMVSPMVILSDESVQIFIQEPRRDLICKLSDTSETLKALDRRGRDQSIAPFLKQIVERLHVLPPRPSIPRSVNAYRIVEELDGGPHYRAFLAEHEAGEARRLKLYELTSTEASEHAEQKQLIYRDFYGLNKVATQGLAPAVDPPFTWNDDRFVVVPQHLVAFPSLRVAASEVGESPISLDGALAISQAVLAALVGLHEQGVIHRNLTPDNTYIDSAVVPHRVQFADFDFARLPERGTIASAVDAFACDSLYRAPEVLVSLAFASPASDIYSVGLMLAELFSGATAQDMLCADGQVLIPPLRIAESGLLAEEVENLRAMLQSMVEKDARRRWQSASEAHELLAQLFATRAARPPSDSRSPGDAAAVAAVAEAPSLSGGASRLFQRGDLIDKQYQVERVLAQGATANTYLVTDIHYGGTYVLKQIRDPLHALQLAGSEFNALKQIHHRGIMRVYSVRKPEDPFHLQLEYVEGESLEELKGEFPWPLSRLLSFAADVLEALITLEEQQVAHRDLSARNIIVTPEGPKLIDFGFAAPLQSVGNSAVGTISFRAPELDRGEGWNYTCDTYSLGVLLFWAATGKYPFARDMTGCFDKEHIVAAGHTPREGEDAVVFEEVVRAICQAIDPERGRRYSSAGEFLAALRTAATRRVLGDKTESGDRVINQWVTDIQGLYRNSRVGNADNRGLDTDFSIETYVPTRLDTELLPSVLRGEYSVVLLSGNPGDGKTAFLEQLGQALAERGAEQLPCDTQNGWKYRLGEHTFAANYDASESSKGKRANDLLDDILRPLRGDSPPSGRLPYTALIAINDGKLREQLLFNPDYGWLGKQIHRLLDHPDWKADPRIALLDLKQRAVVAGQLAELAAGDIYDHLLEKLLDEPHWTACDRCRARSICPIKFNRDSFADPAVGAAIRGRLRALLQITHLRRERHVTMRDLRSVLAYILTAATTCEEIHQEQEGAVSLPERWYNRLYFMAAFNPENEGEDNLREFATYDPAHVTSPRLDRFLHFRRHGADEIEPLVLRAVSRSPQPVQALSVAALGRSWYDAMKRRLFFEGDSDRLTTHERQLPTWLELVPYRHLTAFLQAVSGQALLDGVRDQLCEAISRANGIIDPSLYRRFLCIRTSRNESVDLTIFKRFRQEEFECRIAAWRAERIETLPNILELRHRTSDASIQIGLDLFEILMRFTEGYEAGAEEQQPFVIDLAQFQNRLLNQRASELLLLEAGRQLHRVRQKDGVITLLAADAPERPDDAQASSAGAATHPAGSATENTREGVTCVS